MKFPRITSMVVATALAVSGALVAVGAAPSASAATARAASVSPETELKFAPLILVSVPSDWGGSITYGVPVEVDAYVTTNDGPRTGTASSRSARALGCCTTSASRLRRGSRSSAERSVRRLAHDHPEILRRRLLSTRADFEELHRRQGHPSHPRQLYRDWSAVRSHDRERWFGKQERRPGQSHPQRPRAHARQTDQRDRQAGAAEAPAGHSDLSVRYEGDAITSRGRCPRRYRCSG